MRYNDLDQTALVSVIIPAYNAEHFIERTLGSVLEQTHRNIEVIVVDDGSTDETVALVRKFAADDNRIKLLQQANAGVAAARNTAILASRGAYIAPIDADDLWHPTKLAKQMQVFAANDEEMGLVYTLFRSIDRDDRVTVIPTWTSPAGWVFIQHIGRNFIGNGSSPLVRRNVLVEMGGYTSKLRESGAEGCEDFFLQLAIASKYRFGVVPEHLVGYRRTPGNMSHDFVRILISRRIVLESFLPRCSDAVRPILLDVMFRYDVEIARLGLKTKRYVAVSKNCLKLLLRSPTRFAQLVAAFGAILSRKTKGRFKEPEREGPDAGGGRNFWAYGVEKHAVENTDYRAVLDEFAAMDAKLGPVRGYLTSAPEKGTMETIGLHANSNLQRADMTKLLL